MPSGLKETRFCPFNLRLVLDTFILVAAFRSSYRDSAELIRYVVAGSFEILCSVALAAEYRAVLLRPEHLNAAHMSFEEAKSVIEAIEALATEVHVHISTRPATRDVDDDFVWDVVINGQADALVTLNKKDFTDAGKHFAVPVLTPQQVLMGLTEGRFRVRTET